MYGAGKADELYAALHEFVVDNANDPKQAIIFTDLIAIGELKLFLIFYFYDGPEPPTSGAFAKFQDNDSTIDTTKTQAYSKLVRVTHTSLIDTVPRMLTWWKL